MRGVLLVQARLIACALLAGCATVDRESSSSGLIRARSIEIVDERDVVRMSLSASRDDLAQVRLYDGQGRVQSVFGQALDGSVVWILNDSKGVTRLALATEPQDFGGSIQLFDSKGAARAYIGPDGRGGISVVLLDASGRKVVMDDSGVQTGRPGD